MRTAKLSLSLLLVVGGLLFLQPPHEGEAQVPCVVTNVDGEPRNCTFMEKYGRCLDDAYDSFEQCKAGTTGFKAALCYVALGADYTACLPGAFISVAISMVCAGAGAGGSFPRPRAAMEIAPRPIEHQSIHRPTTCRGGSMLRPDLASSHHRRPFVPSALPRAVALLGTVLLLLPATACRSDANSDSVRVGAREASSSPRPGTVIADVLSATDARADSAGWWVADRIGHAVHRLDPEGRRIGGFGRRGDGPGEFRALLALLRWGDTLVAFDRGGGPRFKFFLADGSFVREERLRADGCLSLIPETAREVPGEGFVVAAQCVGPPTRGLRSGLFLHRPGHDAPAVEALAPERELRQRYNPLLRPLAAPSPLGLWFGEMNGPCVVLLEEGLKEGSGGGEGRRVCPPEWRRVELPPSLRAEFEARTARAAAARALLPIPEVYPAYDGLFPHPDGVVLRVPVGDGLSDLVLLTPPGESRTLLADLSELVFVDGDAVLAAWEEVEGTRIAVLTLPQETP